MALFYGHAFPMGAAFLLMMLGIGTARFLRRQRWWLKFHRSAGIAAAVCLSGGVISAFTMVSQSGGGHFNVPHAWLGLAALCSGITAPIIGHLQFKIRAKIQQLRRWHRALGYGAVLLTALSVLSGLAAAGIISLS